MKVFSLLDIDDMTGNPPFPYYMISDSCIVSRGKPLFLPEWDSDFRAVPSVVIRIGKLGKSIAERFAGRYIDGIGVGMTVRGCDTLRMLMESGKPLDRALSFDGAAATGEFMEHRDDASAACGRARIDFKINGESVFSSVVDFFSTAARFLSSVSSCNKMQTGDLLIIPLVSTPIQIKVGLNVEASIGPEDNDTFAGTEEKKLICRIR